MKNLFASRCETVLTTMRSGNFESVTTKQIAQWLEMSESAVTPFMPKLIKYNFLKKVGAARNTTYELTEACHNSLESQMKSKNDLIQSVKYVVNWFINHPAVKANELTTENGKKFLKVKTSEELDEEANNSINQLMNVINQNKELRAEVELLREEVERLRIIEEKYKQIKSLTK